MTPQLQQSIRLLQLSTLELERELEKYLLDNPLLERAEEYPPSGAQQSDASRDGSPEPNTADEQRESASPDDEGWLDDHVTSFGSSASPDDDDGDSDYQDVQAATIYPREHLLWQLGLMTTPDLKKKDLFELICRNIKFIGLGSADNGDKHGFIVSFISITGRREQMFIHSDEAHNFSSKALSAATKRGIDLNGRKGAKLIDAIACIRNDKFYEYISNNGWNAKLDTYCSNGTVVSRRHTEEFFIEPELVKPKSSKDIKSWNKNVGSYVKNNPTLILNTALALSSAAIKISRN